MCECCPRPVGVLQLICWKLLSKGYELFAVIQNRLLVHHECLIHVYTCQLLR